MKKQKRGTISEEDSSTILQRYTATTVLALLHEVAQVQDVKMDWDALVKKTRTGITNPREYQMLWRHLAYRHVLLEKIEDDVKPLDDDSDLEYELEAFPMVSSEALTEAAACVKVLIASGLPSDSGLEKGLTVEAPLIINIPNSKSARMQSENSQFATMRGTNITIPVSVQKQPLPTVPSAEALDTNGYGTGNVPARRKRKPWTPEEDQQLVDAVHKCGEGNWAIILKGEFKGDRTASQLAQRWNIIKKRNGNSDVRTGSQLSEVHLAARQALKMALDKPAMDNSKAASFAGRTSTPNNSEHPTAADPPSASTIPQNQSHQNAAATGAQRLGTSGSFTRRARPLSKAPTVNPLTTGPDPVKAAAVAAGARIATQSDAAAIFKAAQLKNAIHFKKPGDHLGSPLFSNRHSSIPPNASRPHLGPGITSIGAVVQSNQSSSVPEKIVSSEINNGHEVKASANSPGEAVQEDQVAVSDNAQRADTAVDVTCSSINSLKELVREDQTAISGDAQMKDVQDNQVAVGGHAAKDRDQEEQAPASNNPRNDNDRKAEASLLDDAQNKQIQDQKVASPILAGDLEPKMNSIVSTNAETAGNDPVVEMGSTNGDMKAAFPVEGGCNIQSVVMEICEDNGVKQNQDESQDMHVDGIDEKMDFVGNPKA